MPRGVYQHKTIKEGRKKQKPFSKEWIEKRRNNQKRLWKNLEYRKHMSDVHKGHKESEETKMKNSESHRGEKNFFYGKHLSEEHRKKISEANKNKPLSEEHKRKISKTLKGKKLSKEHKIKISKSKIGNKNSNWQGGKSFEPYSVDWTKTLKRSIRERDNYICQVCSQYGNIVHHIDYNKKNCDPDNLITLCRQCHLKTNYNREYWIKYFAKRIKSLS